MAHDTIEVADLNRKALWPDFNNLVAKAVNHQEALNEFREVLLAERKAGVGAKEGLSHTLARCCVKISPPSLETWIDTYKLPTWPFASCKTTEDREGLQGTGEDDRPSGTDRVAARVGV